MQEMKVVPLEEAKPEPESDYQKAKNILKTHAQDLINQLEAYEIPEEKMEAICDHAIGMKAKFPLMKNARIVRKTVEYFKLKKVES